MGRSRIGWAVSVAAPWWVAFAVLVSITAEAEQEPTEFTSAFARSQLGSASAILEPPIMSRPLRAVDEDGQPQPIVQARNVTGDRDALTPGSDEAELQRQTPQREARPSRALRAQFLAARA
jgi:hypothetical protein